MLTATEIAFLFVALFCCWRMLASLGLRMSIGKRPIPIASLAPGRATVHGVVCAQGNPPTNIDGTPSVVIRTNLVAKTVDDEHYQYTSSQSFAYTDAELADQSGPFGGIARCMVDMTSVIIFGESIQAVFHEVTLKDSRPDLWEDVRVPDDAKSVASVTVKQMYIADRTNCVVLGHIEGEKTKRLDSPGQRSVLSF